MTAGHLSLAQATMTCLTCPNKASSKQPPLLVQKSLKPCKTESFMSRHLSSSTESLLRPSSPSKVTSDRSTLHIEFRLLGSSLKKQQGAAVLLGGPCRPPRPLGKTGLARDLLVRSPKISVQVL